jgi:hypothetical protein
MKSIIITTAAYSIAIASFFAVCAPKSNETAPKTNEIPAATGIMLPEVTISSLPTYTLREIVVSTKAMVEVTLTEVVISATGHP